MGKSQRVKGHSFEREIAISLRHIDPTAKRQLEYQEGLGRDICTNLPLAIQCKASPQASIALKGFQEAYKSAEGFEIPVCAWKCDRKGIFALLTWQDFLEIFAVYHRGS